MNIFTQIKYYIKKNIARLIASAIIGFLCMFFAQSCAKALSLSDNLRTINESQLNYLLNVAKSSDYKNYVITSDYVNNGSYNNYSVYYLCMTDKEIIKDTYISLSTTCDDLITYYIYNNNYNYNTSKNVPFNLNNVIYYSNTKENNNLYTLLLIVILALFSIFMLIIFQRIFRNRYGGLKYERLS